MRITERELTAAVNLTLPNGRLNPDAVGWSRTPLHNTDGIGVGAFGWGRNKRWEYWAVTTPTHVLALTVSSLDYAAVHEVWCFDRRTQNSLGVNDIGVLGNSASLPPTLGSASARSRTSKISLDIEEHGSFTRLRGATDRVSFDIRADRPPGHESLSVVVPWSKRLFQYTVKDVARPASGTITIDGLVVDVPPGESWAVLDHGRGRWPYSMHWNWGAGSGVSDGRVIGVQLGSKWTDGTGSTENALYVDGRIHKISEELVWDYSVTDWLAPWRIHGDLADVTFTPVYDKNSSIDLAVFSSATHQCFGSYSGWMADDGGARVTFDGIFGWAEDVHNRW